MSCFEIVRSFVRGIRGGYESEELLNRRLGVTFRRPDVDGVLEGGL